MPQLPSPPRRARLGHNLARSVLLAAFGLGLFATLGPAPAAATWIPAAPTGHYTPQHVQQLKNNCVWAAGQMLLDKWTNGRVVISQSRLRHASHTKGKAATLVDLSRGIARATGILLRGSPGMGDPMTWWQFLDRLEHGGGGVVIGLYSRLPAAFTRWNPAFAASPRSGHAVYVERYDRAQARVWFMDPLAPRDFPGEWIPVEALRRFATFHGDFILAAATPARHRPATAPLSDQAYRLGTPSLAGPAIVGSRVGVRVGLTIDDGFPMPAAHRFVGRWEPIVAASPDPAPLTRIATDPQPDVLAATPPVATTTMSAADKPNGRGFAATLPVPSIPGPYQLTLGMSELGRKGAVRTFAPLQVQVLPPYSAAISATRAVEVPAGAGFGLKIGLWNVGTADWRRTPDTDVPPESNQGPTTTLVLTWHSSDGDDRQAVSLPAELAPGMSATFQIALVAPREPGDWSISVDVLSEQLGALSSNGSGSVEIPVSVAASLSGSGLVPRR
jgi:hypothetical protein